MSVSDPVALVREARHLLDEAFAHLNAAECEVECRGEHGFPKAWKLAAAADRLRQRGERLLDRAERVAPRWYGVESHELH